MLQNEADPGLLARLLLSLGRRAGSGVVTVRGAGGRRAEVRVSAGRIIAIDGVDSGRVLGDVLVQSGDASPTACVDDEGRIANERIGTYLVRTGRVSAGAMEHAVRVQLRSRLAGLFAWSATAPTFTRITPVDSTADGAPTMQELVVHALRCMGGARAQSELVRELGGGTLRLSELGRELVTGAALRPEETAVVAMLERGATGEMLLSAFGSSHRALSFAHALRRIRAVEPANGAGRYSLLLRKHHELRRSSDATRLLEVPSDATPSEARRALRTLARDLHPDRFDGAPHDALRAVSAEVLKALVRAESELSGQQGALPRRRAR